MGLGRNRAWLVVACGTLVAQAAPVSLSRACDQPCCVVSSGTPSGCCAHEDDGRQGTTETPCRCQLEPREGQPSSQPRQAHPSLDHGLWTPTLASAAPHVPQVLGASREYLAAALAVPIRPPRILFGVWRN